MSQYTMYHLLVHLYIWIWSILICHSIICKVPFGQMRVWQNNTQIRVHWQMEHPVKFILGPNVSYWRESSLSLLKDEVLTMLSFSFFCPPPSPLSLLWVGSVGSAIVPHSLRPKGNPTVETVGPLVRYVFLGVDSIENILA